MATMTLNLPSSLYQQLQQRASQTQRTVEEETLEVLATAVTVKEELPADVSAAIESLKLLDDQALWRAARRRLPDDVSVQLESLHLQRQSGSLSDAETETLARLLTQYERNMLVRAQAAALLKERGHDLSEIIIP